MDTDQDQGLKRGDEIDKWANPANRQSSHNAVDLNAREKNAFEGMSDRFHDTEAKHPHDIKDQEESGDPTRKTSFKSNVTKPAKIPVTKKQLLRTIAKRGGPVTGIAAILLFIGVTLAPSSLFLNLKENLTLNWDQQNYIGEIRSRHLWAKRLSGESTSGLCGKIELACRYSKPSNKMLNDLDKAGIKALDKNGNTISKQKLLSGDRPAYYYYGVNLDDAGLKKALETGDTIGYKLVAPGNFSAEMRTNTEFRAAFRRAYNPRWVNWFDDAAMSFLQRLGLSKAINVAITEAADSKAVNKALADIVEGKASALGQTDDAARAAINEMVDKEAETFAKTAGNDIVSKGKGDTFLTAAMMACVGAKAPGVVTSVVSKYRMAQMAAVIFPTILVAADAIKAGQGTPKMADNIGTLLTSKAPGGKSAMDSGAVLYGLLGDRGSAQQSKTVKKYIPGYTGNSALSQLAAVGQSPEVKQSCNIATSSEAQVAVTALKAAKLANPIGWAMLGIDVVLWVGDKSGALQALLTPLIEGAVKIMSGIVDWESVLAMMVGDFMANAQHEEFGDMIGVLASFMAAMANSTGSLPLTPEQKVELDNLVINPVKLAWAQEDRLTHSPFDATNPNTIMGSFTTQLMAQYTNISNVSSVLSSTVSLITKTPSMFLSQNASAASTSDWTDQCPLEGDYAIATSGAAAGPLCDVQYGVPAKYINTDPDEPLRVLFERGEIDSAGEVVKGSELENHILMCNSGNTYSLSQCQVSDTDPIKAYRALYLNDKRLADGMDNEPISNLTATPTSTQAGGSSTGQLSNNLAWPVDKKYFDAYPIDFIGSHVLYSGTFTSPYVKGIAVDISTPPTGAPIYSMTDGVVTRTNLCGQGDGMIITSNLPSGKTFSIAYGHGTNPQFDVGQSVKAGQKILSLGAIGCQVSGAHLHMDMAVGSAHICPQDVFIAMRDGKELDYAALINKANPGCSRTGQ